MDYVSSKPRAWIIQKVKDFFLFFLFFFGGQ